MPRELRASWPVVAMSAATGIAAAAAWTAWRPRLSAASWRNRIVLVTGGSRGLGLVMARTLTAKGARVILLARDAAELARAAETMTPEPLTVVADVTQVDDCARAIREVVAQVGTIDVLINNAGQILSAPLSYTSIADLRALMDVHFWGTVHMTSAALPALLTSKHPQVVNIASIGAKIAVPHLSAYCASKYAQAGLSSVMAAELRQQGVRVSTVYPGLMRTGSHLQARFRGDVPREFAAFALASGLPGVSMGAERAVRQILHGVARGHAEIVVPFTVRHIAKAATLMPNLTLRVMAVVNLLLPGRNDRHTPHPFESVRGAEIGLPKPVRAAITLSERAASRNNERRVLD
ncbi:MAG: SDR family NAD(P)-dependent oxidoreductase [Acidobacteria bacterium]|nr:SDR family NAD(P)-dependent oxidoreductase [Acidobacteriota bacterium]